MDRLPKQQREALIRLGDKSAIDSRSGLSVFDGIPQNTAGALYRLGLIGKAVRRKYNAQRTVYWLTPSGLAEYRKEKAGDG